MTMETEASLAAADARIGWVLDNPATSSWLRQALRAALEDQPVAAGNDVEVLRLLLQTRADAWVREQLGRS